MPLPKPFPNNIITFPQTTTKMGRPWASSLTLFLATSAAANPVLLRPRQLPWPEPVPASSIGPLDWSTVPAPIYSPPTSSSQPKAYSSNKVTTASSDDDSSSSILPRTVDWRNRANISYITTAQDQGGCNSCWAFAVTGLIESQIRIEHGTWSKRSEADMHDNTGAACESVGNAEDALAWVAGMGAAWANRTGEEAVAPGVADWPCDPYQATAHGYEHCWDRRGRAVRIPFYQAMGEIEDQKRWLDRYGPVVATFVLYADFGGWKPEKGVYKWDGVSQTTGNHLALVVGYDDDRQAWIMKNSWGKGWGMDGFVYFA